MITGSNQNSFDAQQYRMGMRRFANAVHIITTGGSSGDRGLTVSACCSVSNEPPTVLCCIYQSERNKAFLDNGNFCINTLAPKHKNLAQIFAGCTDVKSEARFEHGEWHRGLFGEPLLNSALMTIECELISAQICRTHYILVGAVAAMHHTEDEKEALIYLNQSYHYLPVHNGIV